MECFLENKCRLFRHPQFREKNRGRNEAQSLGMQKVHIFTSTQFLWSFPYTIKHLKLICVIKLLYNEISLPKKKKKRGKNRWADSKKENNRWAWTILPAWWLGKLKSENVNLAQLSRLLKSGNSKQQLMEGWGYLLPKIYFLTLIFNFLI